MTVSIYALKPKMITNHSVNSTIKEMIVFNNKLHYLLETESYNYEFWEFDGINNFQKIDFDANVYYANKFTIYKDELYFRGFTRDPYEYKIWKYNGVNKPISLYIDSFTIEEAYIYCTYNDKLYFTIFVIEYGDELWEYDGINQPTIIYDINPYNGSSIKVGFDIFEFKNNLYFVVDDGEHGKELWVYDGENNPKILHDINFGERNSNPSNFTIYDSNLYFSAYDSIYGYRLFIYDNNNIPHLVDNEISENDPKNPYKLIVFNNKLIFGANSDQYGNVLWEYNGIDTPKVIDLNPEYLLTNPDLFYVFKNKLYFSGYSGTNGYKFWEYDGINTPKVLKDIKIGLSFQYTPSGHYIEFNNKLYFRASNSLNGVELWEFDGKNLPNMVFDLNPGDQDSDPTDFTILDNKLYFHAFDEVHGSQLWALGIETDTIFSTSECNYFISPSGKIWDKSGIYKDTIQNSFGWDSIITINLTLFKSYSFLLDTACINYTSPSGKIWDTSGIYLDTIFNAEGCDSIIEINLLIKLQNLNINQLNDKIYSNILGDKYNWLDCDNNYSIINDAVNQEYYPETNGNYSLEVTIDDCVDTSACLSYSILNIIENSKNIPYKLYPNPIKDNIIIELGKTYNDVKLKIYNHTGEIIYYKIFGITDIIDCNMKGPKGIYVIEIITGIEVIGSIKILKY